MSAEVENNRFERKMNWKTHKVIPNSYILSYVSEGNFIYKNTLTFHGKSLRINAFEFS